MTTTLITLPAAPTAISYVPVKAEQDKAVRKLVEDEVCQAVRRAVNAWLYAQEG